MKQNQFKSPAYARFFLVNSISLKMLVIPRRVISDMQFSLSSLLAVSGNEGGEEEEGSEDEGGGGGGLVLVVVVAAAEQQWQ